MNPESKPGVSKWLWITLIIVVLIGAGFFSWYYLMGPGKKVASTATPTTTTAPRLPSTENAKRPCCIGCRWQSRIPQEE